MPIGVPSLPIGLNRRQIGVTDVDALGWQTRVVSNGGTVSVGTLAAMSTFVTALKAANIWTKINRINMFAGTGLPACLTPLKVGGGNAIETNNNFVAGDYSEATGLTGNGITKFLQTGFIPSVSLSTNDSHIAIYNRAPAAAGGGGIGSRNNITPNCFELYPPFADGNLYNYQYNTTAGTGAVVVAIGAAPFGLVVGSRTGAAVHNAYKYGAAIGATDAGAANNLPTIEAYLFAYNLDGVASLFGSHAYAGYSFGNGLTAGEVASYHTAMQAFQTALGRQV